LHHAALYGEILTVEAGLDGLGSEVGRHISQALRNRFSTTGDGILAMLSFVLTPEGLLWVRHRLDVPRGYLGDLAPEDAKRFAGAIADRNCTRAKGITWGALLDPNCQPGQDAQIGRDFDDYLHVDAESFFARGQNVRVRWRGEAIFAQAGRSGLSSEFTQLASKLTEMPCSEAAAERFFRS
jgi:hypothetical protein